MAGEAKDGSVQGHKVFENSTDYISIISWAVLVMIAVTILEIWIYVDTTDPTSRLVSLIIGVTLGIIAFCSISLRTLFLRRPKSVEILNEGVKLNMRGGKRSIVIAWPDILTIELATSVVGKDIGAIRNDIAWYYPLDHSIAVELRGAYHQRMGKYPPKTLDELCPGMIKDMLAMSSRQWNKKYERFKKKN